MLPVIDSVTNDASVQVLTVKVPVPLSLMLIVPAVSVKVDMVVDPVPAAANEVRLELKVAIVTPAAFVSLFVTFSDVATVDNVPLIVSPPVPFTVNVDKLGSVSAVITFDELNPLLLETIVTLPIPTETLSVKLRAATVLTAGVPYRPPAPCDNVTETESVAPELSAVE